MANKAKPGITLRALFFWLIIGGLIGWQLNTAFTENTKITTLNFDNPSSEDLDLDLFWDVWDAVKTSYVDIDEIQSNEEVYGAISGLVDALEDPYSSFMTPEETQTFHENLDNELEGVGMELSVRKGMLVVISPLKDTPAERAGIMPGDFIYMVDDKLTGEMTLFDAIMAIRGEAGTEVKLTVIREGEEDPLELKVIREKINVPSVTTSFQEENGKNIAIVALSQFGDTTTNEFMEALRQITLENADSMVLDLRLNGGGYLDVSVDLLSEFFTDKEKVVIVKRRNTENEFLYTKGNGRLTDIPLVVLIDEGSASASEIVAGAIQDYERGVIIGETSFGKGSVQELATLKDGSSLRLTVAKWYTPLDRGIDEIGITPDIQVDMEYKDIDTEDDIQLQSALDYLSNL
ncbi:S41 family peptidase [Patescibacteria group bacterium]|nr:S41 family peptidase [Patescibacteria group bacterium]